MGDTEDMVDIMVATTAEVMATHMVDTDMDIMAEKSDPLRLKLNQKLMLVPMLGMAMEDMVDTDIHTDTDTDVIMDTVVMAIHMDTTDTTVKCHAIETVPAKTTLPSSQFNKLLTESFRSKRSKIVTVMLTYFF